MKAVFLTEPRRLETRDVESPRPGPGEVLVRVGAVGVCGSDVHYFEEGRIGSFVVHAPLILGHEVGGIIAECGDGVSTVAVGDRVAIEPQRPCMFCVYCLSGRYNVCPDMEFLATPPVDGAFCEYIVVPEMFAHVLPAGLDVEDGAMCEPLSVGIAACRKAEIMLGSRVLISGGGTIGLVTAWIARASGASEVIVTEPNATRRAVARDVLGVETIDPSGAASLSGVDAYIDASGSAAAIRNGIATVHPHGRVVLVGMGNSDSVGPVSIIQNRELIVTGVFRYTNTWPLALKLLAEGTINLRSLITGRYGLDEVEQALRNSKEPHHLKVMVRL